jgi:hypothetical protein
MIFHLHIHTNDYHMDSFPKQYKSTSKIPNYKYQISKILSHFFSLQKVIPRRIQHKYYDLICSKLLKRILIINTRAHDPSSCNVSTKTFLIFLTKNIDFTLGYMLYVTSPITFTILSMKLIPLFI